MSAGDTEGKKSLGFKSDLMWEIKERRALVSSLSDWVDEGVTEPRQNDRSTVKREGWHWVEL